MTCSSRSIWCAGPMNRAAAALYHLRGSRELQHPYRSADVTSVWTKALPLKSKGSPIWRARVPSIAGPDLVADRPVEADARIAAGEIHQRRRILYDGEAAFGD